MAKEPNITELAVAAWRLERWLDNLNADRKMAAKKSLREIKNYLVDSGIEIVDPLGWKFDPGLAFEVVNNEAPDVEESELIVIQTSSPIIKKEGGIIQHGKVILGTDIKKPKENNAHNVGSSKINTTSSLQSGTSNVLKQEKTEIYYVNEIELYEDREGLIPCVEVQFGMNALMHAPKVFLLDKFNYKECFLKGISPQVTHGFTQKEPLTIMQLPYQGNWYVIIYDENKAWREDYDVEINLIWNPKSDELVKTQEIEDSSMKVQTSDMKQNSSENNSIQLNTPMVEGKGEKSSSDKSPVVNDTIVSKKEVALSSKALKKIEKKNMVSFYIENARESGAYKDSHKKSTKKGSTKKKRKSK